MEEYLAIFNPVSGRGEVKHNFEKICSEFNKLKIPFYPVLTEFPGHAADIAEQEARKGRDKFIIIGGDGTMNQALNGFMKSGSDKRITIGMIPSGTGNDWARYHNIPNDFIRASEIIANNKTKPHDIGLVISSDKTEERRYFMNMAGIGFDSVVADRVNILKESGKAGTASYFKTIIKSLVSAKSDPYTITLDGIEFNRDVFSMSIGICSYNGGGMKQAPDAIFDDGLFDVVIINTLSWWGIVTNLPKLFSGSHVKHSAVEVFRAKNIKIETSDKNFLETEGEVFTGQPYKLEILPNAVDVLVP